MSYSLSYIPLSYSLAKQLIAGLTFLNMDQELPLLLKDLGGSKLAELVHSFSVFGLDEDKYWKVCNAWPRSHVLWCP
jgi:hypothetical protein